MCMSQLRERILSEATPAYHEQYQIENGISQLRGGTKNHICEASATSNCIGRAFLRRIFYRM